MSAGWRLHKAGDEAPQTMVDRVGFVARRTSSIDSCRSDELALEADDLQLVGAALGGHNHRGAQPVFYLGVKLPTHKPLLQLRSGGGRAINNGDPSWPETLVGFAQRAYEFYKTEPQPRGYRLRAEILNFPGGKRGEVGINDRWMMCGSQPLIDLF